MTRSMPDRPAGRRARRRPGAPASQRPEATSSPSGWARPTSSTRSSLLGRRGQVEEPLVREDGRRPEAYTQVRLRCPDGPLRARVDPLADLPAVQRDDRTAMGLPPRSRLSRLFADLGWRAYAIPLLVIATALTLVDVIRGGAPPAGTPSAADRPGRVVPSPQQTVFVDGSDATRPVASLPSSALPRGGPYQVKGNGQFDIVPGTSRIYGTAGPLKTFTVEVEQGITIDQAAFAAEVEKILGDSRGWTHGGALRFQRVDAGNPDFRVTLTTPTTIRRPDLCGYEIKVETSCFNRQIDRVLINEARWVRGAVGYGSNLDAYRAYAITHETGHALGRGHQACPAKGALAPPMMQQTLGLTSANGLTCRPNPWPFPSGDREVTGPATRDPPQMN